MRPIALMLHLFERFCWLDDGLQARLHDLGWPDVSRPQSMVMLNVTGGITRPSDIARRMGVSRQAIHSTIAQMVRLGMVTLETDAVDARHKHVVLTEFGTGMRNDAQAAMNAMLAVVAERIGPKRFADLLTLLEMDWGPISDGRHRTG